MTGMVRITYWLGWFFLVVAVISRVLLLTSVRERMVDWQVLPRNFLQLTIVFFLASIASYACSRISKA